MEQGRWKWFVDPATGRVRKRDSSDGIELKNTHGRVTHVTGEGSRINRIDTAVHCGVGF